MGGKKFWRRERDSNPRGLLHPNGFQDRRNRPLCHLSGRKITIFLLFSNKKLALSPNCFKKRIFTALPVFCCQENKEENIGMKDSRTAVVILNWNGKAFLEKFLPAVVKHSPGFARVIVADNASTDDSISFLKENYPDVEVIALEKNFGYAGGYNAALRRVEADFYVLLNSDIEVSANWIPPVIRLMEKDPSVAACQPKILDHEQRAIFEYAGASGGYLDKFGYPFCRGRLFSVMETDEEQYDEDAEVFWASGACMFIRADAFHAAGGFDERFFAHMEEIDLCWRLKNKGYRIMACPESVVYHVGGGTLPKSNPRKTFLNFRNSLWLISKNLPSRYFYLFIFFRLALDEMAAAKFLFSGQFRDFLAVYKAHFAFIWKWRSMRRESKYLPAKLPSRLYKRSIALDFFLGRKKYFYQLKKKHFVLN